MRPNLNPLSVKPSNPKSLLWRYYGDCLNGVQAFCVLCKESKEEEVKVKVCQRSIGGLKSHLNTHKEEYQEFILEEEKKKAEDASKSRNRPINNNLQPLNNQS